jgi:hypothetical protein
MKFLQAIDNSFIGRLVQSKLNIIEHTNPNRIYVENIRSFYNMPFPLAKFFCEMAAKQGFFIKQYGIKCPNQDNIIKVVSKKSDLPDVVHCDICESLGKDRFEFNISECKIQEFYKLNAH